MKRFIGLLAGGFCIVGAAMCSGADAFLNYEAYAQVFGHSLMGVGGLACAVLAFAGAACFSVAARNRQWSTAALSGLVALAAAAASINGTYLRVSSAGDDVAQAQADRAVGYDLAYAALQRAERRLAAIDADLALIRSGDVAGVQALMKAKGYYDGQVDGRLGPQTEAALERYAAELSTARDEAAGAAAQAEPIVRAGRPVSDGRPMGDLRALIFSVALTLLGAAGSSAGFATVAPPKPKRRKPRTGEEIEAAATVYDLTERLRRAVG